MLLVPAEKQTTKFLNTLTVIMLSLITFTAVFVKDLGVINTVGGGTIAVFMCFCAPCMMFQKAIQDLGHTAVRGQRLEVKIVLLLTALGCVVGIVGVATEVALGV